MFVGRLRNSLHRGDLGKNVGEKARCLQKLKSASRAAFG